jgi:glutamate synthase (NADPH/NADH) small chain
VRIHLGMPDSTGRQMPQEIPNSHVNIEADLVLKALGFDPEDLPKRLDTPELGVTGWGTLKIDWRSMMTSLDGVFAAGDIVRGASLVVWAVRDGRDAAERIHTYLTTKAAAAVAIAAE